MIIGIALSPNAQFLAVWCASGECTLWSPYVDEKRTGTVLPPARHVATLTNPVSG
jgi:hypothetical protein